MAVAVREPTLERGQVSAEDAREYAGQWVAIKGGRVEKAYADANDLLDWIEKNRRDDIDLVTKLPKEGAARRWSL
ncbi:MAG: hypothetical protein KGK34_09980 [Chloroflexota bacterium]|nr:hypothetical protein [Chloroflexota bacterium]